ncbi:MAG: hypothetical protein JWR88_1033 [Pseudonocardia sp.]|nr:hypothetical protein [Pseudonocardia sp.]
MTAPQTPAPAVPASTPAGAGPATVRRHWTPGVYKAHLLAEGATRALCGVPPWRQPFRKIPAASTLPLCPGCAALAERDQMEIAR